MPTAPSGDSCLASLLDVFHHIGTAIVTIDENHRVASCLVGAEMFGLTAQSIIGVDAGTLVCSFSRSTLLAACQQLPIGHHQTLEFRRRGVDGQLRTMIGTLHRQDGEGRLLWFVVCEAAPSPTEANSISQLQSGDFETKMSALRDLSGAVSHHLNNVIGGALTSIDFALDSQDEQRMQKTLMQASQLMVKAGSIIGGLQVFAVGDQHSQDLRSISKIIDDTLQIMAEEFAAAKVRVNYEVSKRIDLETGTQKLTTVLRALLKNAIESAPRSGVVRIGASTENQWVVLHVIDDGCGIDAASLPHVFEPFWTTKEQFTTTAGEGTGLGLAMVHGIVTSVGGKIKIESSGEEGTHITVYWPIIEGA